MGCNGFSMYRRPKRMGKLVRPTPPGIFCSRDCLLPRRAIQQLRLPGCRLQLKSDNSLQTSWKTQEETVTRRQILENSWRQDSGWYVWRPSYTLRMASRCIQLEKEKSSEKKRKVWSIWLFFLSCKNASICSNKTRNFPMIIPYFWKVFFVTFP